jgi:hypothetical protein
VSKDDLINRQTAGRLGTKPNQATSAAAAAAEPTATQTGPGAGNAGGTGDAPAEANPVSYEVDFGGEKRSLTPEQIAGTFARYAAMNHRHAALKPIIDMAEQLIEKSGVPADKLQALIVSKLRGGSAPEGKPAGQPASKEDREKQLSEWEQQNAAQLPPGYRDMFAGMNEIREGQDGIKEMLAQVLAAGRGVTDASAALQRDARQRQIEAIKGRIGNNLNKAQAAHGLPDEAAKDFMMFAAERGFTLEDFADEDLTLRVAGDYKAIANSGEFVRLKEMAARRQAFTGTLGSTPAGGAGGGEAPKDTPLSRIAEAAAKRRG